MPARNSDGTIRNARTAKRLTDKSVRARWIEAEVLRLKRFGLSFTAIAHQITQIGRGLAQPMSVSEGVKFPPNFSIGHTMVHKAYHRAINREPNLEAAELRRLDSDRCEDYLLSLQPGIRKGEPRAVEVAIRVLDHKAKLNGYVTTARMELTGKDGGTLIPVDAFSALLEQADLEDEMIARQTHAIDSGTSK
jgi:hypothetical protein